MPPSAPCPQRIAPKKDAASLEAERKRRIAAAEQRRKAEKEKQRAEEARLKSEEKARRAKEKELVRENKRRCRAERKEKLFDRFAEGRTERTERSASARAGSKRIIKDSIAYFIVFLCVLLIICTATATVTLWQILNYGERPATPSSVTFTAGGKDYAYAYSDIVRDGVYYVNFTAIAKLCDLSLGGDDSVIIYSTSSGEQLRFTPPSRNVLINGNAVLAESDIIVTKGGERRVWVPLSLVRDYVIGIDIELEEGVNEKSGDPFVTITVSRVEEGRDYLDVSFKLKYNSVLSGISNDSLPEEPVTLPPDAPIYEFSADLSRYLQYMCPADYDKYMILINPSHLANESYIPDDLVGVPNPLYDNGSSLCRDAAMSLEALFIEMHELGFRELRVRTAYRSYEAQKKQFEIYVGNESLYYIYNYETTGKWFSDTAYAVLGKSYLEEKYISKGKTTLSYDDAVRVAMSYSAYPGTSDHQTGLGFDLTLAEYSTTPFVKTPEYLWLVENAHKFGFVFRYPEGKENITGFDFEPQHLRFIGQYYAAIIHESGLSLDEYVDKYMN
ncbi:MAG: D-alanyl-D-alanine carboxypeptidase family protein [Eubacteriales bacterium]